MNRVLCSLVFILIAVRANAQTVSRTPVTDSSFSVYWNRALQVSIHIFNPAELDELRPNAVLEYRQHGDGASRILRRDSLYITALRYRLVDLNGDGQKDLLLFRAIGASGNHSYHLYLVNQRNGGLLPVQGFHRVLNPTYNWNRCILEAGELYDHVIMLGDYLIDAKGKLFKVITH